MKIEVSHNHQKYRFESSKPLDISIPLQPNQGAKCFYAPDVVFEPFTSGDFIGSVKEGAPVNYFNVRFNPHGNGTHTECLGHITKEHESVNQHLKEYCFMATLISVQPSKIENGDLIISLEEFQKALPLGLETEALIIRTLLNLETKLNIDYSHQNPPYLSAEAMEFLVQENMKHLLIDLPSVDREEDEGKLQAHHIFWGIHSEKRPFCTITEMVFISDSIPDGLYFLNLQIASFELDASPSKPVIYSLENVK